MIYSLKSHEYHRPKKPHRLSGRHFFLLFLTMKWRTSFNVPYHQLPVWSEGCYVRFIRKIHLGSDFQWKAQDTTMRISLFDMWNNCFHIASSLQKVEWIGDNFSRPSNFHILYFSRKIARTLKIYFVWTYMPKTVVETDIFPVSNRWTPAKSLPELSVGSVKRRPRCLFINTSVPQSATGKWHNVMAYMFHVCFPFVILWKTPAWPNINTLLIINTQWTCRK